jgi:hypothetical protein
VLLAQREEGGAKQREAKRATRMQASARRLFSLRVPKKSRASRLILHPSRENDPFIPPFPPAEAKVSESETSGKKKPSSDCVCAGGRSAVVCAFHQCARAPALPRARHHDGE